MHIATDEGGRWLPVGYVNAVRFNLQGAVIRAAGARARDVMNAAESALRACSADTFAGTLSSSQPMTHAKALEWLDGAVSVLATLMVGSPPARSRSAVSGLMLRVSDEDAVSRRTTGTDGDDE